MINYYTGVLKNYAGFEGWARARSTGSSRS